MTAKFCRWWVLCSALVLVFAPAGAAEKAEAKPPQISEAVATALQKINQLVTTEQWDAALAAANDILKTTKPGSYDQAMTQLYFAQIHLSRNSKTKGDYAAAIPVLTAVINSGYFTQDKVLEWKYILAQLDAQEDKLGDAEKYIREWLAETPAPTADAYVFYTTLMVQRSQENSAKPDKKLAEQALQEIHKGLLLGAKPNETLFYLQAACYQTLEKWSDAAESLEMLLRKNPRNKTYWSQLFAMYVTAGDEIRAALTIERAQQLRCDEHAARAHRPRPALLQHEAVRPGGRHP